MAKQYIQYECEICERKYQNEEEAIACEDNHFIPKDVVNFSYDNATTQPYCPLRIFLKVQNKKGATRIVEYRKV